jgi:Carboxypeptidase regulatory-like domain
VRLLSFTVAASIILVPLAAHSQMGCIKGVVVDDAGQPLPGMHVGLAERTWDGGQKPVAGTVTDNSGAFEIDDVPPGTHYELGANNDALVYPYRLPQPISVAAPGPCTTITYDAGTRVGAAKLKFKVTDAATNKPISDLTVHAATGTWGTWLPVGDFLRAGIVPQVPSSSKLHIEITAKGYSPAILDVPAIKPGEVREVVCQVLVTSALPTSKTGYRSVKKTGEGKAKAQ